MASEGQKSESCGAPQIAVLFTYFREQNLTWAIGISYPGLHSVDGMFLRLDQDKLG